MELVLILLLVVGVSAECGKRSLDATENFRIVNGGVTKRHAWPWLVPVLQDGVAGCVGTIVDKRWVLTAAHCFWDSNSPEDFYIVTGEHNRGDTSAALEIYKVDKIFVHNDYDFYHAKSQYDIAMLHLTYDIHFDKTAQPICLPDLATTFDAYTPDCFSAGWGQTEDKDDDPNLLHEITTDIVDNQVCDQWYRGDIFDNMLCFGGKEKKPCAGDSGAPVMCRVKGSWTQAGIFSWGSRPCKDVERPAVTTRVTSFMPWIMDVMSSNGD